MSNLLYLDSFDTIRSSRAYASEEEISQNEAVANAMLKLQLLFNPKKPVFSQTQMFDSRPIINMLLNDSEELMQLIRDKKVILSLYGQNDVQKEEKGLRRALLQAVKNENFEFSGLAEFFRGSGDEYEQKKRREAFASYLDGTALEGAVGSDDLIKFVYQIDKIDREFMQVNNYESAGPVNTALSTHMAGFIAKCTEEERNSEKSVLVNLRNLYQNASDSEINNRSYYYKKIKELDIAESEKAELRDIIGWVYNLVVCASVAKTKTMPHTDMPINLKNEMRQYLSDYTGVRYEESKIKIYTIDELEKKKINDVLSWKEVVKLTTELEKCKIGVDPYGLGYERKRAENMKDIYIEKMKTVFGSKVVIYITDIVVNTAIGMFGSSGSSAWQIAIAASLFGLSRQLMVDIFGTESKELKKYKNLRDIAALQLKYKPAWSPSARG